MFSHRSGHRSGLSAYGGWLFPRGKSHQKRAKTRVLESFSGRQARFPQADAHIGLNAGTTRRKFCTSPWGPASTTARAKVHRTSTFHTVSGSGTEVETVLHFMPLANFYKRVERTITNTQYAGRARDSYTAGLSGVFCILFAAAGKKYAAGGTLIYAVPTIILPAESRSHIPHGILEIQPARGVFSPAPVSPRLPMSRQKQPDMKGRTKR